MGLQRKPRGFQGLYAHGDPAADKRSVEELRRRILERLLADPDTARKAALILEAWLRPPRK